MNKEKDIAADLADRGESQVLAVSCVDKVKSRQTNGKNGTLKVPVQYADIKSKACGDEKEQLPTR